ncbi:hypothetical protein TRIP_B330560 [uncultured Desulfatiglans sp.]|uniref:Uncharacterized protein n=1 Tax=Uncultured Desulfatiglans sp. TaxID=1748965 RepID=A0A653A906_UNCDX|nr:hypothetical protein TRIP_B330560 [uncultured Desulfatiglans sp.]
MEACQRTREAVSFLMLSNLLRGKEGKGLE